jgi:hypothetical protein
MVSLSALSSTFNKETYMKKTIIAAAILAAGIVNAQETVRPNEVTVENTKVRSSRTQSEITLGSGRNTDTFTLYRWENSTAPVNGSDLNSLENQIKSQANMHQNTRNGVDNLRDTKADKVDLALLTRPPAQQQRRIICKNRLARNRHAPKQQKWLSLGKLVRSVLWLWRQRRRQGLLQLVIERQQSPQLLVHTPDTPLCLSGRLISLTRAQRCSVL